MIPVAENVLAIFHHHVDQQMVQHSPQPLQAIFVPGGQLPRFQALGHGLGLVKRILVQMAFHVEQISRLALVLTESVWLVCLEFKTLGTVHTINT